MINIQDYSEITIIEKDVCKYKRKLNNDEIKDTNLLLKNILGGDWSEKIRYTGHIGSDFVIILDNSSNDIESPSIIIKIHNKWLECAKEMHENEITQEKLELILAILTKYNI